MCLGQTDEFCGMKHHQSAYQIGEGHHPASTSADSLTHVRLQRRLRSDLHGSPMGDEVVKAGSSEYPSEARKARHRYPRLASTSMPLVSLWLCVTGARCISAVAVPC